MMELAGILIVAAGVSALIIWISPWCLFLGDFTEDDIHRVQISFRHLDNKRTNREILSALGLMLLLPIGWYLLEQYLLIQRSVGAIHVISNPPLAYAVQSFIFSFMLGAFIGFILMYPEARQLGTFREFRFWGLLNTHYTTEVGYRKPGPAFLGVHWWSYLKGVIIILMVFSYFFTCFITFDCATFTTPERIVTNSLVEFQEHEYTYDQVDRILFIDQVKSRSGDLHEDDEPGYAIFFKDGYVARTRYWAMGFDFRTITDTVEYISLKSGVPIEKGILNIDVPAYL